MRRITAELRGIKAAQLKVAARRPGVNSQPQAHSCCFSASIPSSEERKDRRKGERQQRPSLSTRLQLPQASRLVGGSPEDAATPRPVLGLGSTQVGLNKCLLNAHELG